MSEGGRAAITDSVRQVVAGLAGRLGERGNRAFPPVMDSAPGYLWAYNGFLPFTSFDSMAAWARADSAPRQPHVFAWDTLRIGALAPGVATIAATYVETSTDSAGARQVEQGVFTAVAVHRAEGWRFTNAHTSTLPPPRPPAPARR